DEMKALGYEIVDIIVEHYEALADLPVTLTTDRPTLEKALREPMPEEPTDFREVLEQTKRDVFAHAMYTEHPRFFAFVPGPSNFVSAMAASLATGYNAFAGTWMEASGPAMVELVAIDWLRQMLGLPEGAGGQFVSGGSMANLEALATARHVKLSGRNEKGVLYYSDQTHSSVDRGLRVLGFHPEQIRKIPADVNYHMPMPALERAVYEDRDAGLTPFCVIANAGTTNTGAIDPLPEMAAFCRENGLWLHVDAAYGGAISLTEHGKALLEGIGEADSVTIDPHKWLFQPYDMGCVLVKDPRHLRQTFRLVPEYLKDTDSRSEQEVNFYDYGVQLTRGFTALRLWMSIKIFGIAAFRDAVAGGIEQAEYLESLLRPDKRWDIVTPAHIGVITFQYMHPKLKPADIDEVNRRIVDEMVEDGYAMIATTVLRGRTVQRMCTINPRTTHDDLRETLKRMGDAGDRLAAQMIAERKRA
ncbi:MAG: aminotransferase class I/II-fold pyridoxal phosphate-dependent enzyme, partial [Burkholderiales bacterium]|nr:aminotransferase class I/II-fold pyridoxal phosphate-dependent enzyme [Anaerolineae bacterium]